MRGLRIYPKLIGGFTVCVILSAVIGVVAIINLSRIKQDTVLIRVATEIEKEILECRRQEKNIMLFGPYERATLEGEEEKTYLEKVNNHLIGLRKLVKEGERIAAAAAAAAEEEEEEFNAILREIESYEDSLKEIVADDIADYDEKQREADAHILNMRKNARRVGEIAQKIMGIASMRIDDAHKTARNVIWLTLIIAVVFGGSVGIFLSRSITNPIGKLTTATGLIAKGDLNQRVDIKSTDEIGELADFFNKMTKDLSKTRDEIISARDYADNIIKSMIDTVVVVNPDATLKTVNKATCDLLGYSEDELIGRSVATIFAAAAAPELFKGTRLKRLKEEGSVRDYEMTYKTKAGEKISVSFSCSVMRDKDGNLVGIVGIARDMREIKRRIEKEKEFAAAAAAAAAEKKKAAELERAYKELWEKSERLERFHKVTVGRELEMVKLKGEVNTLLEKIGQPKKYEAPDKIKVTEVKE